MSKKSNDNIPTIFRVECEHVEGGFKFTTPFFGPMVFSSRLEGIGRVLIQADLKRASHLVIFGAGITLTAIRNDSDFGADDSPYSLSLVISPLENDAQFDMQDLFSRVNIESHLERAREVKVNVI